MSAKFAAATRLTAAAATAKHQAYQIALESRQIRGLESKDFNTSFNLAQEIDPAAVLNYIRMGDRRDMSLWRDMKHGHWVLWHPRLGEMKWVGEDKDVPRGEERMKRTKLFVCRGCISGDVRSVVVESRKKEAKALGIKWNVQEGNVIGWPCVDAWMKEAREE